MLDLKEMIKDAMFGAHRYDTSNHEAMLENHPDFILHNTDEYMATLIQEVADQRPDVSTIFVVCGYGQSRSIPHYLYFSPKVKEGKLDAVAEYKPVY